MQPLRPAPRLRLDEERAVRAAFASVRGSGRDGLKDLLVALRIPLDNLIDFQNCKEPFCERYMPEPKF